MSGLPEGWIETTIGSILDTQSDGKLIHQGWSPRCHAEPAGIDDWGVLKTTAIQDGYFLEEYNKKLPVELMPKPRIEVKAGDLLMTNAGPRVRCGVTTLVKTVRGKLMLSGKMYRMRFNENYISPRFVEACFRSEAVTKEIDDRKTGMSESGLNLTQARFLTVPIKLCPYNEQIRIADMLDSLLAKVDKAQARLENIPVQMKRFRQSVLAAATSGELTREWRETCIEYSPIDLDELMLIKKKLINDKRVKKDLVVSISNEIDAPGLWSVVNLGGLASKITDGEHKTPKREDQGHYLLSARNVRDGKLSFEKVDYVGDNEFAKLRKRCNPNQGDILISCSGSVGRIAICDKDDSYVMVRSAALVKTNLMNQNNKFLMYVLQSPQLQKIILEKSRSTAQANLFLSPIKELPIPLPSVEEQKEIVRRIESLFALADTVEKQHQAAKARLDRLTQSILAKAFRGELVPQDPNDEPAAELLKRIQEERESKSVKKPKQRKLKI